MKRLITMYAVVGLMLSATCVSWASLLVGSPPEAPEWWNAECDYYAYGWWEPDLIADGCDASPLDDVYHWASNFLSNTDFTANWGMDSNTISIDLDNIYSEDHYKEIYIYLQGTTTIVEPGETISGNLDTDGGSFEGEGTFSIGGGFWSYVVEGEIYPQPDFVLLSVTVPELTGVTNIWAGENCIPEPATIALLGLGSLALLRKRESVT